MLESSNDIYFLKLSHDITKQSQIGDDVVPSRSKDHAGTSRIFTVLPQL